MHPGENLTPQPLESSPQELSPPLSPALVRLRVREPDALPCTLTVHMLEKGADSSAAGLLEGLGDG